LRTDCFLDLGEISRNILLHLIDSSLLFSGFSSPILNTHYGYDTSFVSKIEGARDAFEAKEAIIKDLGMDMSHVTDEDVEIVRWVTGIVAERASSLAACAVAAVVLHTGNDKVPEGEEDKGVDVGLDGR
jgi:hexokinase